MSFAKNDRVRVRDKPSEKWKKGTVYRVEPDGKPQVTLDQHETPGQFNEVEMLRSGREKNWQRKLKYSIGKIFVTGFSSCYGPSKEKKKKIKEKKYHRNLIVKGLNQDHRQFHLMGTWVKTNDTKHGKPIYQHESGKHSFLWRTKKRVWAFGDRKSIGTDNCGICTAKPTGQLPGDYTESWMGHVNDKWMLLSTLKVEWGPVLFNVGDKVRMRDRVEEKWKYGTVIQGGEKPHVVLDGHEAGNLWKIVEHASKSDLPPTPRNNIFPTDGLSGLCFKKKESEYLEFGTFVEIHGLIKKSELNGRIGQINSNFDEEKGRYQVKLKKTINEKKAPIPFLVKPENLEVKTFWEKGEKVEVKQREKGPWLTGSVEKAGTDPTVSVEGWQGSFDDWYDIRKFVAPRRSSKLKNSCLKPKKEQNTKKNHYQV